MMAFLDYSSTTRVPSTQSTVCILRCVRMMTTTLMLPVLLLLLLVLGMHEEQQVVVEALTMMSSTAGHRSSLHGERSSSPSSSLSSSSSSSTALQGIAGVEDKSRTIGIGFTCHRTTKTSGVSKSSSSSSSSSLSLSPVSERIVAAAKKKGRPNKSKHVLAVNDDNYRSLVNGDKPLLLDAYAQWCGPCKLIEPLLEECATSQEFKDTVVVGKFDVEGSDCKDVKVELLLQGVMPKALPSLILLHKNQVLETWNGIITTTELHDLLNKHVRVAVDGAVAVAGVTDGSNTSTRNTQRNSSSSSTTGRTSLFKKKVEWESGSSVPPASRPFRGIGLAYDF